MDGGAWQATLHGVTKSQTRLSDFTFVHKIIKYSLWAGVKPSDVVSGSEYLHMFSSTQSVYVLNGALNPFTLKVIINMYDPITIFLTVLGLFSVGFFLLLCFLPKETPLAFVVKLVCGAEFS